MVVAALLLAACGREPLSQGEVAGNRLSLNLGQTLSLKLQTIGPGEYASPPEISSAAIRFLEMSYVSPAVPAGPTQEFRFRSVAPGLAIIAFRHTGQNPMVKDTVEVR
jgi:hypothetical protein